MHKDNRERFTMVRRFIDVKICKHILKLACKTIFFCLAIIGAEDVLRLFFGG